MLQQLKRTRRWRGRDRGYLRALQKAILMMSARDQRMDFFIETTAQQGNMFDNSTDGRYAAAMQLLMDRIDFCLVELTP